MMPFSHIVGGTVSLLVGLMLASLAYMAAVTINTVPELTGVVVVGVCVTICGLIGGYMIGWGLSLFFIGD